MTPTVPSNEDWDAEHDIRTLREAEAIQKDPKRMNRAKAHAKKVAREMGDFVGEDGEELSKQGFRRLG
ncbi:MAG: hypothetical protein ACE5JI_21425 [Acidobacteriota bacterium]